MRNAPASRCVVCLKLLQRRLELDGLTTPYCSRLEVQVPVSEQSAGCVYADGGRGDRDVLAVLSKSDVFAKVERGARLP